MDSILNPFKPIYHTIYPLAVNACDKIVALLEGRTYQIMHVVQEKISDRAKRLTAIALLITGSIASCYFAIKYLSSTHQISVTKPTPTVHTLTTEYASAKKHLFVDRRMLVQRPSLKDAASTKIFLNIQHDKQHFTETAIIPAVDQKWNDPQIEEHFIEQINLLFDRIQSKINFNNQSKTDFKIGMIMKRQAKTDDEPTFERVEGHISIEKGASKSSEMSSGSFTLSEDHQQAFCNAMEIPWTPFIDPAGKFI